jgi:hypothetical protein
LKEAKWETQKKDEILLRKVCVNRKVVVCLPPVSAEVESRE